jgi:hypothetical protein
MVAGETSWRGRGHPAQQCSEADDDAAAGQCAPIHKGGGAPPGCEGSTGSIRQALAVSLYVFVEVVGDRCNKTPLHGHPRSGFRFSRRGEVSANARAQGEGSHVLWPLLRPLHLTLSTAKRLGRPKSVHFSRLVSQLRGRLAHSFYSMIQGSDSEAEFVRKNRALRGEK